MKKYTVAIILRVVIVQGHPFGLLHSHRLIEPPGTVRTNPRQNLCMTVLQYSCSLLAGAKSVWCLGRPSEIVSSAAARADELLQIKFGYLYVSFVT